jgi:hypothetical protein
VDLSTATTTTAFSLFVLFDMGREIYLAARLGIASPYVFHDRVSEEPDVGLTLLSVWASSNSAPPDDPPRRSSAIEYFLAGIASRAVSGPYVDGKCMFRTYGIQPTVMAKLGRMPRAADNKYPVELAAAAGNIFYPRGSD